MTLLHVEQYGSGPPLLAIHGVTGHARRWERLAVEAWPHRTTIAVDLRGHGFSTWLPPWSTEQMVIDVIDTLDHFGLDAVDVVGNSYGAAVGLHLMAAAPERVRCLVGLDPALMQEPASLEQAADDMMRTDGWATVGEALAARNVGPGPSIHPAVIAEAEQHLVCGSDGRYRFRYSRAAAVTVFGELARPVPNVAAPRPALVVAAERPRIVTQAVSSRLRMELGELYMETSLDCGHLLYWERFDETAVLVEDFLRRMA